MDPYKPLLNTPPVFVPDATISVDGSRQFTFHFVPEGMYTLKIKDGREVRHEADPNEPAFGFGPPNKETVLQAYGPGELRITVSGDVQGVNVPVQAMPASAR